MREQVNDFLWKSLTREAQAGQGFPGKSSTNYNRHCPIKSTERSQNMRVELNIDPNCKNPRALLYAARLTPSLKNAIAILEKENEETILTAQIQGKTFIIEPDNIEIIRTEGRELVLYDIEKNRFLLGKPLYELENILGKNFVRISKSALVNIFRIHHVEAAFNGTMAIVMKNGIEEIISRSYRQKFKDRLGV